MSDDRSDAARQFSRQAEAYAASPTHAHGGDLDIIEELAECHENDLCLDIATGPGNTAFRLAREAGFVVASDIAPGMLAVARRQALGQGLGNLGFVLAAAEALPFPSRSFDLVSCRIAPHHFASIPGFLAEVARVLQPSGRFVLEDSLAPERTEVAGFLEEIEKRRDPSHVHTLSDAEWRSAFADAGLLIKERTVYRKVHEFGTWIARTGLPAAEIAGIEAAILEAPPDLIRDLFEIRDGRVARLTDDKLIVRAGP